MHLSKESYSLVSQTKKANEKETKKSQSMSDDGLGDTFCWVCSKLVYSKAARTHSTQECNQLAKLNQRLEAGTESEKEEVVGRY